MRLGDAQREFAWHVSCLIQHIWAYDGGIYTCTLGDAYRDPRAFGKMGEQGPYGRPMSAHKQRLAIDLNLYKDFQYQTTTKAHEPFGQYWEALHPDNVWGGGFRSPDGNHYARRYGGIA
jgi:hypothetical protein